MKIKVCGMRNKENIESLIALKPDFMGFIFYKKSARFVADFPKVHIPSSIKKAGVFVNETIENCIQISENNKLDCIQLHGNETPEYCKKIHEYNFEIIKVFSVDENFDFECIKKYEAYCDYFLFDTKGKNYGGNGTKFNWDILANYKGKKPYLLSGGIAKIDVDEVKLFFQKSIAKKCIGIDINSGFETEPAVKNINEIKEFKQNLA